MLVIFYFLQCIGIFNKYIIITAFAEPTISLYTDQWKKGYYNIFIENANTL
jgi:hypothetical protein